MLDAAGGFGGVDPLVFEGCLAGEVKGKVEGGVPPGGGA